MDESRLILEASKGDLDAFNQLVLKYYSQSVEVLKIPLGTLKSRLARACFQMKEKFQRTFEYPGNNNPSEGKACGLIGRISWQFA